MATDWGHASQCSGCSSIGGKKTVFVTSLSFFRLVTNKNKFCDDNKTIYGDRMFGLQRCYYKYNSSKVIQVTSVLKDETMR